MNLNFNEICRLCLRFCEKYVDLNQQNGVKSLTSELAEKIKFCYLIQMDLAEGLPTKVCYECIQVISFFYIAKKNVLISEQLLRDVLYMRKKLPDESKICKGENITGFNVNEIKPEEQKTSQSLLATDNKPHDNICKVELSFNSNSESNSLLNTDCKKGTLVSQKHDEKNTVSCKQNSGFKVKKKKKLKGIQNNRNQNNNLGIVLNEPNSKPEVSLKYKDFKRFSSQSKKSTKTVKVNATETEIPKTDTPLGGPIVKEIGTVIDTSNILSPNVKRTRKSVLGR